jgi:surfeit locus 1 family protein
LSRSSTPSDRGPRHLAALIALAVGAALVFAGLVALGTWQVHRRAWKLDLIERVDQRVHTPAVKAPGAAHWTQVDAASDEYRHVRLTGILLNQYETLTQASTVLGGGFWVMTPLRQADGSVVLINRGFVSTEDAPARAARQDSVPQSSITLTGLLRLSEPNGGFLRHNDPIAQRWYSRDVQAIATAQGLANVAPYFVDADASTPSPGQPVGGLTVIAFHNNHLMYAITWYTLALMVAGAAWYVARDERAVRRRMNENAGHVDPHQSHDADHA